MDDEFVPDPPGAPDDISTRIVAEVLLETIGRTAALDNGPGAVAT